MKNEFTQKTKELFNQGGYMVSGESGRNWANAIHHILGRCSNSPYNAIPLNNSQEHLEEGRKGLPSIHSFEVRSKYLIKTKKYLDSIGYIPTEEDLLFLKTNEKFYEKGADFDTCCSFPL